MKDLLTPQLCGLAFLLFAAPTMAQGSGHERFHPQYRLQLRHDWYSNDVIVLDFADLDQDGYPEMLYSDPYFQAVAGRDFNAGRILVLDGKTGALLFEMHGPGSSALIGRTAHFLDDITGDGIPDISFTDSYQFANHLHLLSGADFSPLIDSSQHDRYYQVISVGDRTGDGISELAAVRYSIPFGVSVDILDGSDLSLILRKSTGDVDIRLTRLGDLDGDGLDEIGTFHGLPVYNEDRCMVLRGASLRTMQRFAPEIESFNLLVNAGDVDADGVDDVLASQSYWDHLGIENSGLVKVLSGATGNVLALHYGQQGDYVGGFLDSLGDLNGDGHSEYLVGAKIQWQGGTYGIHSQEVRIFSGATHTPIDTLFGRESHYSHQDRAIAVFPATINNTAFIGLVHGFRPHGRSDLITSLNVIRFGN